MDIKELIEAKQQKWLEEKIYRSKWSSIRASGIGDPCARRIYYYITQGELAQEMTTDLVSIFEEGKNQEPGVRRYLSELGFEIMKAGNVENWKKYNISGTIDGTLETNGQKYIVEIKTVSDFAWDKLQTIEDFDEGYYKKWFAQMQIYLLLFGYEKGLFILKKKSAQQIRVIEADLNYDYAESLLKKAEHINDCLKSEQPPDYLKNNPCECKRCPFFGLVCNPPLNFDGEIANIEDEELARKLARRNELAEARAEYEALDKEVKERIKEIPHAICGDFEITGKKRLVEYKAKEAWTSEQWITKINKITGKGKK